MKRSSRTSGLTLVEMLLSIALLGIGVLAAFALQVSSLQGSAKAEQLTNIVEIAKTEMDVRVKTSIPDVVPAATPEECVTHPGGDCLVSIRGCKTINNGDGTFTFLCEDDPVGPRAYEVTVTHTGPRGDTITLVSISTGYDYIGGNPGGVGE